MDGEGVPREIQTPGDLASTSPRSAVPPEKPSKHAASGVRFRGATKSPEEFSKELAELRARYSQRDRSGVKSERGGRLGFRHLALAMALLSLALVTLLAVFHSTASPPVEAAPPGKEVCAIATTSPFV